MRRAYSYAFLLHIEKEVCPVGNDENSHGSGAEASQSMKSAAGTMKDTARGTKSIVKAAAKAAAGDAAGAAVELAKDLGNVLKALAIILLIVFLMMYALFYAVPASIVTTLFGNTKAFDVAIPEIQSAYNDISSEACDTFTAHMQAASEAAREAGQAYLDSILAGLKNYDKVNVTTFTVGIAEKSPVQTAQDLSDDIYLLTALYDEHERNGAGFDNDAFIREKEAAHANSPITTEERLQWAGEAIDAQLKDVSVDGLKRFFGEEAENMLCFIFPTPYMKEGVVLYPAAEQGTRESGPYKNYSVRSYTYTVSVAATDEKNRPILDKDGNPTYIEEMRTGCDVECEYLWRIEFDGVNHLLQEYGWATIGSDGNPVFTEEGEAHYKRAVELVGNYKSFLETGGLDFTPGIGYGSSYKGSYQQLIINEYEERQASAMPLNRNMEEPLKGTYVVTSDYGIIRTITSVGIQNKVHHGIDMAQGMGSPIYSTADGIVVATGSNNTNGIHMLIYVGSSGNKNYYTLFNHCSGLYAKVGDRVSKGQQVAAVGSTGASTGAHLDFGVLVCDGSNGAWYVDPRTLVPSIPKP